MKSRIPCLAWGLLLLLFAPGLVFAQQTGTVSGRVIDQDTNDPLPGATVQVEGTSLGAATGVDGTFELTGVPAGEQTIVASFVGFQPNEQTVQVTAGETVEVTFSLGADTEVLDEVVVTGVSVGTSTKKLGFSVSKVSADELQAVPASDPANALRAKTPGARIVQASGQPGNAPSVRLRGTSTLSGSQEPLLVVDGAITGGSLEDIDMQAVESIEIIKGAAAASLYGSLAGNGVIQVITKRGADEANTTRVTVRNEVGFNQLANTVPLADHHNRANADGDPVYRSDCGEALCPANPQDDDGIFDNDYARLFDQQETLFSPSAFFTNFVSVASRKDDLNYLISFENLQNGGVIENVDPYQRRNLRLNVDNQVSDRIRVSASTLYSNSTGFDVDEQGQGNDNPFYGALIAEPDLDLDAPAPDSIDAEFNPLVAGGNAANPLYRTSVIEDNFNDERLLGNLNATFEAAEWLTLDGQFSYDQDREESLTVTPAGTFGEPDAPVSEGDIFRTEFRERLSIASGRAILSQEFGELNATLTGKYTYEDRRREASNLFGSDFLATGVPRFQNTDESQLQIIRQNGETPPEPVVFEHDIRSEDIVGNLQLDFRDRYIIDAVLRRESVSLFGPEARDEVYYRVAGTYRLTEDFTIPRVSELKLRGSFGTSGSRPPFRAQYETFTVTSSGITKERLGNRNIAPANVQEFEFGLDASFLDRFYFEGTYSATTAEDQVLEVPLTSAAGFKTQFQNAATVESSTIELAIGGQAYTGDNFTADFNLIFDRTRQEVTQLNRPSFNDDAGAAIPLFRIAEGTDLGVMFGNKVAESIDDLLFDEDGCVVGEAGCLQRDDLTINSDGYVTPAVDDIADETPLFVRDEQGNLLTTQIGDANPDFNMGLSTTLRYKNASLFATVDWEQGADVYNYTKQLLYFNDRHGDLDQADKPADQRRPGSYYTNILYNGATATSHFVEDGSYVKVREISLSYRFTNDLFKRLGIDGTFYDAQLSISGRNLFTFTGYTGFDPEVSTETADQPSNYKIDDFAYPNFRTFTASLEFRL